MEVPRIDYAPPLPLHRRRRVRKYAIVATIIAVMIPIAWLAGPRAWRRVQIMYWQHQALNYSPPPDQIVLDDDPSEVTRLLNQKHYLASADGKAAFLFAKPWDRLYALWSPPGRWPSPTLFVHERKNSRGERRLVVVEGQIGTRVFERGRTTFVQHADVVLLSTVTSLDEEPRDRLRDAERSWNTDTAWPPLNSSPTRWWAGQTDSEDEGHFTISFEAAGARRIIDGWLLDDDTVKLQERH